MLWWLVSTAPEESAKSSLVNMMAEWLQEKVAMADRWACGTTVIIAAAVICT